MARRPIFTPIARRRSDSHRMDLIAIALGLAAFAVLLALIEGIDWI